MSAFTTKEDSDILTLYGQVCEGNDTTCKIETYRTLNTDVQIRKKLQYFLIYQSKHMFLVLKRTFSIRRYGDGSFEYPQHMFLLRNRKNNLEPFPLILRPVNVWLMNQCLRY